jgi:uncharacterized protein
MTQSLSLPWKRIVIWSYILISVVCWSLLFYMGSHRKDFALEYRSYGFFNFVVGFFLILLTTALIFGTFHLLNDAVRFVKFLFTINQDVAKAEPHEKMNRFQFFNQAGLALGAIWLGANLYGVTKGKFAYRLLSEKIKFPNLPEAFHGMKIVQISDLHLGSFNEQFDSVQEGFDLVNSVEPDYIFFTGDMVNNFSDEAEPWIESLKGLKAKYGKYSILGNHDYGDYALGEFPDLKAKSFNRLCEIHKEAGFTLLRNENVRLEKDGQQIVLAGSENWGLGFHQYGDMDKTFAGTTEEEFKILLSHDPTHWQEQVVGLTTEKNNNTEVDDHRGPTRNQPLARASRNVALTLSGHTHGAQFGVELPSLGIKFSPVQLRYKRWGGLYQEEGKYLYINRGFGFLAFPGRVGMPPEVTLIELQKG